MFGNLGKFGMNIKDTSIRLLKMESYIGTEYTIQIKDWFGFWVSPFILDNPTASFKDYDKAKKYYDHLVNKRKYNTSVLHED